MTSRRLIPYAALTAAAAGASLFFVLSASQANGVSGFPLDDAWIHLQFARNLHDYGSFSYFQDRMVTSGSTSPLYTLLLAAGFFLTSNEMVLSYALGILSHVALVILVFLLMRIPSAGKPVRTGGAAFPLIAAGLTALEPRLTYASVSGMETSLFTALLLGALLAYRRRHAVWLGVTCGLALWTRPEAVLFVAALVLDLIYDTQWREHPAAKKREAGNARPSLNVRVFLGITVAFAVAYGVWNSVLSGTVLPNTYAAKLKYYGSGSADFGPEMIRFLTDGHLMPFVLLAGVGAVSVVVRVFRRKPQVSLVQLLWIVALTSAYWLKLPHLYQEGRYLMPLLPFVLMLGVDGLESVFARLESALHLLKRNSRRVFLAVACGGALVLQFVAADLTSSRGYAGACKYIEDRQVTTARWIRANLPEDAIVATHDVGAVAFYGGRRIVDMVGLVSPGMIKNIGSFEGLQRFLLSQKVTHVAVLRNWFEVANQTPLFQTDEQSPEIMEVFSYDPGRTRFISQDVTRGVMTASMLLGAGRPGEAMRILEYLNRVEPGSARVHYLMAVAAVALGRPDQADAELHIAVRLQPDHWPARTLLAEILHKRGNVVDARKMIDTVLSARPEDRAARHLLELLSRDTTAVR
jgi:hypothetical protein